jgi:hypothetical protein
LLGIYYGLEHSISSLPKVEEFRCHCDNEADIKKIKESLVAPGQAMRPDMDIVLAIHNLVRESGRTVPDKATEHAFAETPLREYTTRKLNISPQVLEMLEDKHFTHVRSTHDWHRIVRTSKMLFGWLPVGHNRRHHGTDNDLCPCCGTPDEMFLH